MKTIVHEKLIIKALDILKKEKPMVYSFFLHNDNLINGAQEPDFDEHYNGSHYYVYNNKETYYKNRLKKYMRSAKTSFLEHYTMAIYQYMNGYKEIAYNSLGRAIHYITDLGTPPHTSGVSDYNIGASLFTKPHSNYEYFVVNNIEKYLVDKTNKYAYYMNEKLTIIINDIAYKSSRYKNDLLKKRNYECMTEDVVLNILESITGIINRFYNTINNNPFYIKSNEKYLVENKSYLFTMNHLGLYEIDKMIGQWKIINEDDIFLLSSLKSKFKKVLNNKGKIVSFDPFSKESYVCIKEEKND